MSFLKEGEKKKKKKKKKKRKKVFNSNSHDIMVTKLKSVHSSRYKNMPLRVSRAIQAFVIYTYICSYYILFSFGIIRPSGESTTEHGNSPWGSMKGGDSPNWLYFPNRGVHLLHVYPI